MPLLTEPSLELKTAPPSLGPRSQSQHSSFAKSAIMSSVAVKRESEAFPQRITEQENLSSNGMMAPPPKPLRSMPTDTLAFNVSLKPMPASKSAKETPNGAMNDTPISTAPTSPNIPPLRRNSADKLQRARPTTLDIPGLTKSSVSPDGKIAARDVGAKLVIVMVGLPARGKSYITKKMARYLNWLQHDTRIFNVGERRRIAAGGSRTQSSTSNTRGHVEDLFRRQSTNTGVISGVVGNHPHFDPPTLAAHMLLNGESAIETSPEPTNDLPRGAPTPVRIPELLLPESSQDDEAEKLPETAPMDQSADFFDPNNQKAALIREQCALDTLDELLDYILEQGGSVGILDATNSTLHRRKLIMKHIRARAGPDLNVLFMESVCVDKDLLERNMRLKLSGPDYKDKDPEASLADFRKRVAIYEKNYVPLGEDEENHKVSYVQMVDVGRKVISHQIKGFLMAQAVYYLLNFNLAPRQIWITRHGESQDNLTGKLGGDSELTPAGIEYAKALTTFLTKERKVWEIRELERESKSHLPPQPGDTTPPNPHFVSGIDGHEEHILQKSFCVWTSMLKRSIQTAQYFNDDDWDLKQMRMLDELNAGTYEGCTYEEIKTKNRETFDQRRRDKLLYRYPGPGGEGYLDVINRLRPVIVELERMTDHVLLIGHRSVARILIAYFLGLPRDDVTDLDVPIGMLYCLEPRPYGVDFKAYRHNPETKSFDLIPRYTLQRANSIVD